MTSIVTINASGTTRATATSIPADLVYVQPTATYQGVVLPAGAVVGTLVEIHVDETSFGGTNIYPASGDDIDSSNITVGGVRAYTPNVCAVFRKITDTLWGLVSSI
jgi:hypothetical protein